MLTDNKFSNIHRHNNTQQQQNYNHPWPQPPPPQWPIPPNLLLQQQQQQEHRYLRVHPEYLIRTVIASKIMQEQRAAATAVRSPSSQNHLGPPPPSPSTNANDGASSPFSFGLFFDLFLVIIFVINLECSEFVRRI